MAYYPNNEDDRIDKLRAENAALKAELAKYKQAAQLFFDEPVEIMEWRHEKMKFMQELAELKKRIADAPVARVEKVLGGWLAIYANPFELQLGEYCEVRLVREE